MLVKIANRENTDQTASQSFGVCTVCLDFLAGNVVFIFQ